jgi:hypothetical protein
VKFNINPAAVLATVEVLTPSLEKVILLPTGKSEMVTRPTVTVLAGSVRFHNISVPMIFSKSSTTVELPEIVNIKGSNEGANEGEDDGAEEGIADGTNVGSVEGEIEGCEEGRVEGRTEGRLVGRCEGKREGN